MPQGKTRQELVGIMTQEIPRGTYHPTLKDSDGDPVLMKVKRPLNWYYKGERDRSIMRIARKRQKGFVAMRPPLIEFPCFMCGITCWNRRPDLKPTCDGCRAKYVHLKDLAYKKWLYAQNPEKYKAWMRQYRIDNPDAQRNVDRRSYYKKMANGLHRERDRKNYLKEWRDNMSEWQEIKKRADGRRISRRNTDKRRYGFAFKGQHHRNHTNVTARRCM